MPTIKCYINQRAIEKATKQQRDTHAKITLIDPSGLRLAINSKSASWNYNYRKRGVDFNGKRHPQRTLRLGDTLSMNPDDARARVAKIKSEVRNGGDPAAEQARKFAEARRYEVQQQPLSIWLDQYREHVLGDTSRHKREEYVHAKNALQELSV